MQEFGHELLSESQLMAAERLCEFMYNCLGRAEDQKGLRRPCGNGTDSGRRHGTQGSLSDETLVLVRSRGSDVHFLVPRRDWERIRNSVEVDAFAFNARRVAVATGTDMSSYATWVLAFVVLELETNFLITSLESKLPFVLFHYNSERDGFLALSCAFLLIIIELPLHWSRRSGSVFSFATGERPASKKFHCGCKFVDFVRERF